MPAYHPGLLHMHGGLGIQGVTPLGAGGMIAAGAVLIVVGVRTKKFYGFFVPTLKLMDRESDPTGGKTFFCAVGGALVFVGLLFLFFN
jgi:hypothetical protein